MTLVAASWSGSGSWLPSFVDRVLPRIRGHFVLVTGDSPSSLPSSAPAVAVALLESPYMLHWYTQNYDGTAGQGRVSPIPVGVDLHTRSVRPAWGRAMATPAEQEAELDEIAHELPPLAARIPAIYIDFVRSAYRTPPRPGRASCSHDAGSPACFGFTHASSIRTRGCRAPRRGAGAASTRSS